MQKYMQGWVATYNFCDQSRLSMCQYAIQSV